MGLLTQVLTAFGLSASAGLNAYIPLLIIALLARFTGWVKLSPPFDVISNEWVIVALVVLLVIETFADKIPGIDHVNDFIQTFIRPTAGAVLFASEAHILTDINPVIPLIAGLLIAFSVHATKATARPVVNLSTLGVGAPVISTVEDVTAVVTSLVAVFLPFGLILLALIFLFLVFKLAQRVARRRAA